MAKEWKCTGNDFKSVGMYADAIPVTSKCFN